MPKGILVKEIENWREFYEVVAGPEFRNWAFRGQSDAAWPLYSALSRYIKDHGVHPRAWADQEWRIINIFKRKAHLFLDHVPDEKDAFQWLALMQHHGAPTRLLDFTWSPFVAAFFALERATKDAAVWAVFIPGIHRKSLKFNLAGVSLTPDDLSLRNKVRSPDHPDVYESVYEKFYIGNEVPFVTAGEPFVMNKRLIAQSGTFIATGVLDQPVEQILSGYPKPDKTVAKFTLKTKSLRDDAMLALYNMNITNATLFPDLDGLAKSMGYELEYHWAYNPKTMKPHPGYKGFWGWGVKKNK